jgi:hypothetical protein
MLNLISLICILFVIYVVLTLPFEFPSKQLKKTKKSPFCKGGFRGIYISR